MRGRSVGRICNRLAVGVFEFLDVGICLCVPEIRGARCLCAEDAHRRALRVGAEHTHDAGRRADIDRAGKHRLLRFAAARGVEQLLRDTMFFEDAGFVAEVHHRRVPVAALADRDFHEVVSRRRCGERAEQSGKHQQAFHRFSLFYLLIESTPPSLPTSALTPIESTNSTISSAYMRGMLKVEYALMIRNPTPRFDSFVSASSVPMIATPSPSRTPLMTGRRIA